MSAPIGEGTEDNAIVPLGAEIFCSYQFHKRWSLEAGFDFRSQKKTTLYSTCGNSEYASYNFSSQYMDLPVKADFHFLGKRKFNFDLVFGLKGTWRYYDEYGDSEWTGKHYNKTDNSFNTAFTCGFKESFRISSRIKINAEQLANHYFTGNLTCGGGADLKLGLEYFFSK